MKVFIRSLFVRFRFIFSTKKEPLFINTFFIKILKQERRRLNLIHPFRVHSPFVTLYVKCGVMILIFYKA